jgi:hypothetical protein
MLTVGIVAASLVGMLYTQRAESAIAAAAGNAELIKPLRTTRGEGCFWR